MVRDGRDAHQVDADTNRTIFIVGIAAVGSVVVMYLLEKIF
ncbi:hypothetical protein [Roseicella aquatilis]|nr:hypothetical protein [Roseicella aquatilis]